MPSFCAVFGCSNRAERNYDKSYYRLPSIKKYKGIICPNRKNRRNLWLRALRRKDLSDEKLKYTRICSDHFVTGKPSFNENDVDYVPSINLGYDPKTESSSAVARRNRRHQKELMEKVEQKIHEVFIKEEALDNFEDEMQDSTYEDEINDFCVKQEIDEHIKENIKYGDPFADLYPNDETEEVIIKKKDTENDFYVEKKIEKVEIKEELIEDIQEIECDNIKGNSCMEEEINGEVIMKEKIHFRDKDSQENCLEINDFYNNVNSIKEEQNEHVSKKDVTNETDIYVNV